MLEVKEDETYAELDMVAGRREFDAGLGQVRSPVALTATTQEVVPVRFAAHLLYYTSPTLWYPWWNVYITTNTAS